MSVQDRKRGLTYSAKAGRSRWARGSGKAGLSGNAIISGRTSGALFTGRSNRNCERSFKLGAR